MAHKTIPLLHELEYKLTWLQMVREELAETHVPVDRALMKFKEWRAWCGVEHVASAMEGRPCQCGDCSQIPAPTDYKGLPVVEPVEQAPSALADQLRDAVDQLEIVRTMLTAPLSLGMREIVKGWERQEWCAVEHLAATMEGRPCRCRDCDKSTT